MKEQQSTGTTDQENSTTEKENITTEQKKRQRKTYLQRF